MRKGMREWMGVAVVSGGLLAAAVGASPDPLGGPSASKPALAPTLVLKSFDGKVVRPEMPAEEAALRQLGLSEEDLAPAKEILTRRAKILDDFVIGNIDLLTKLGTASATGDKLDQLSLALMGGYELRELWADGSLRAQIRKAIPAPRRAEYDRLLNEYDREIVKEKQASTPPGEKPKNRLEIAIGERMESLGREIERAYKRQEYSGDLMYGVLTRGLALSGPKAAKVREVCREFAEKTRKNEASEKDKADMYFRVMSELDESERDRMNKNLFGAGGERAEE